MDRVTVASNQVHIGEGEAGARQGRFRNVRKSVGQRGV
jgi:hypothetical protein